MADNSVYVFNVGPADISLAINGIQFQGLASGIAGPPYTPNVDSLIVVRCFQGPQCPPGFFYNNGFPNIVQVQETGTNQSSASVTISLDSQAEDLSLYVGHNWLAMFDLTGHLLLGPLCVKWADGNCPESLTEPRTKEKDFNKNKRR